MDKPIFSIIVPVYNAEKYLKACLKSIREQTYTDFEVILVDDGSPDNCPEICDEFREHEPRCRVIHQENRGLSGARNAGLKIARGKYIYFFDSDDIIANDLLENLYKAFNERKVDVVGFDATVVEPKKKYSLSTGKYTGQTEAGAKIAKKRIPLSTVPLYCYRAAFLINQNLAFMEKIYYEDVLFTAQVFLKDPQVYYLGKSFYLYNKREGSITTSHVKLKNYKDIIKICEHLINSSIGNEAARKNVLKSYILLSEEIYRKMDDQDKKEGKAIRNSFVALIKKSNLGLMNYITATFLDIVYLAREIRRRIHGNSKSQDKNKK